MLSCDAQDTGTIDSRLRVKSADLLTTLRGEWRMGTPPRRDRADTPRGGQAGRHIVNWLRGRDKRRRTTAIKPTHMPRDQLYFLEYKVSDLYVNRFYNYNSASKNCISLSKQKPVQRHPMLPTYLIPMKRYQPNLPAVLVQIHNHRHFILFLSLAVSTIKGWVERNARAASQVPSMLP